MSAQTQGAAVGFGTYGGSSGSMTPVTFKVYNASNTEILSAGFVMPTVDGFTVTQNGDQVNTKNGRGDIDSHTVSGEYLEASFDLVFTGSSAANQALAERGFPPGSTIVIEGAPVRTMGSFTDAINVATSGSLPETARWHPMPGMSIRRTSTGTSTGSVTLRRYPLIAGGAAIVT
jgi:hypothetical protein